MIVRILGEGQLSVDDTAWAGLAELDVTLEAAVKADDEAAFRSVLTELLERVRVLGTPVPADSLDASDVILPHSDASMDDVRALLVEEGHIPG